MKSLRTILLLLSMFVMSISYAYDFKVEGVYYNVNSVNDYTVTVTHGLPEYRGDIVIPSSVTNAGKTYSVTCIGSNAFDNCRNLSSIVIPSSITSIKDFAFVYCTELKSINIPNSVKSIGEFAFQNCYALTSITIPNSVTSIGEGAFYGSGVTYVSIPSSITYISISAFAFCSNLTSIAIPNSVTSIGNYAFEFSALTSVTIPNSVTQIGNNAFYACELVDVYCNAKNVPTTGTDVFDNYYIKEASLYIPETALPAYKATKPWSDFGNITSINVQNPIISYSNSSIKISSATSDSQIYYTLDGSNPSTSTILYTKPIETTTPCTVKAVAKKDGCEDSNVTTFILKKVPSPIISYENGNVIMGTASKDARIYYTLDGSVPTANSTLYEGKFALTENCTIKAIGCEIDYINSDVTEYLLSEVKDYYEIDDFCYRIFNKQEKTVELIRAQNSYGSSMYSVKYNTDNVTIPNKVLINDEYYNVVRIGESAFCNCGKIKNIVIPNSVTSFGMFSFSWCTGLGTISIPNSVTIIESYAFDCCKGLTDVFIPSSITNIGSHVFGTCPKLTTLKVDGNNPSYCSEDNVLFNKKKTELIRCVECKQGTYSIPNTVTNISEYAFQNCIYITSVNIPNTITDISDFAFWGCSSLTSLEIPSSINKVGAYSFSACSKLTHLYLPKHISLIENGAFSKCLRLKEVFCYAERIPSCSNNIFEESNINSATLYVPEKSFPDYGRTSPWSEFGRIESLTVKAPIIWYDNYEINISCATEGAKIYYTLDGSDPSPSTKLYTEPIGAVTPCTVRAIAKREGYDNSDVTTFALTKVSAPEISYTNGNVYMSAASEGIQIYYTLDGSEPTEKSTLYKGKFEVDRNYTIKAIGYQENHINSDVVEYKVTGVKTKQPEIIYTNFQLYLTCQSAGSKIYYTLDGTNPKMDGKIYTTPVPVYTDCIVKAYAKSPDLDDSDISTMDINVTEYTCATPQISRVGNSVKIECLTDDVTIYYTIDGQNPTDHSAKYSSPIVLSHNCTIKAIAMKDGHLPSPVSTFTADWFRAETPTFSFADGLLTISCGTDGSIIYYELGEGTPSRSSNKYVQPIALTDNRIVKAIAVADGFNDSEIATYNPNMFSCETPQFAYDGRAITISTETPGADIYYTMDGTNPTEQSNRYTGTTILNGLCTIRAIAMKENMNNSTVSTLALPAYYNGGNVYVETPGKMSEAFIWCGGMPELKSLTVCGKLNATDIALIKNSQSIKFLDLVDVTIDELQDEALADMNLVSVAFPTARFNVGKRLLVGCNDLAVIDWNSTNKVPDDIVGDAELPNLLLYLKSVNSAGNNVFKNVVVGNTAEAITLQDSEFSNFYCLREFTARKITYTHNYSQKTGSGKCTGWETIALPFTPTAIHHATNGQMAPFAINDATKKPFWLCELTESGFVNSDAIVANTPYIIAMPNNEHYADEYILSGDVTFEGSNVKVLASSELNNRSKDNKTFVPNFMVTDKDECMTMNVGETYEGHAMGSMFVQGLRNASPFEAYVTMEGLQSMARQIFCIDGTETGIYNIESENINISIEGRNVLITGITDGDNICIYNVAGSVISSKVATDDSIYVNNLPSGVFVLAVKRNGMMIKSIKLRV